MQLAQVNVAPMRFTMYDNRMDRFVRAFGRVNAAAEAAPGFVWRWEGSYSTQSEQIFGENMLVNISVWTDAKTLHDYVYGNAVHTGIMAQKEKWFHPVTEVNVALWWVEDGHQPSLVEAKQKLDRVKQLGPTAEAFSFEIRFEKPQ